MLHRFPKRKEERKEEEKEEREGLVQYIPDRVNPANGFYVQLVSECRAVSKRLMWMASICCLLMGLLSAFITALFGTALHTGSYLRHT